MSKLTNPIARAQEDKIERIVDEKLAAFRETVIGSWNQTATRYIDGKISTAMNNATMSMVNTVNAVAETKSQYDINALRISGFVVKEIVARQDALDKQVKELSDSLEYLNEQLYVANQKIDALSESADNNIEVMQKKLNNLQVPESFDKV